MATLVERARRALRDHVLGPSLRTYEAACEELGGQPWRELPETERWFVGKPEPLKATPAQPLPVLDSSAILIKRELSERQKLVLLGGSALLVIVLCIVSLVKSPRHAPAPMPAATVTSPALAPAAPQPLYAMMKKSAPSVQSLFGPSSHSVHKHRARHHRK